MMALPKTTFVQTGEQEMTVRLAAFVITADKRRLPKEEAALALVEALLALINGHRWGLSAITAAQNVKAENLFSGRVDKQGVALWAVTWDQAIRVGEDIWQGGVLPSALYVNDDPEQTGHAPAYEQVTP